MENVYDSKVIVIFVLIVLSLFLLGVNVPAVILYILNNIVVISGYIFLSILSFFGYTTGSVVNKVSQVTTDGVRFTADTVDGTFHSFGDILVKLSDNGLNDEVKEDINYILNTGYNEKKEKTVHPVDESEDKWCLVGHVNDVKTCMNVKNESSCQSQKMYKTKDSCTMV